jgi:CMP-N,N'-diacetyllegionaminic acid synthase
MVHAAQWMRDRQQYVPEWTMILMPTSPLRQARHLVEAVELAVRSGADSVVSVDEIPAHYHPLRALTVDERGWARLLVGDRPVRERPVRRQGLPAAWVFNGAIYLFRTALLFDPKEPSLYGDRVAAYPMTPPYGHNIDDPEDWAVAEGMLSRLA